MQRQIIQVWHSCFYISHYKVLQNHKPKNLFSPKFSLEREYAPKLQSGNEIMRRIRCFIFLFNHISKVGFRACTRNNQINHWLFICMMFCCITCYTSKKLGCCESLDVLIGVEISGQYDSSL